MTQPRNLWDRLAQANFKFMSYARRHLDLYSA